MEQEEIIYEKIKEINSEKSRDILKDIIVIDGAIVQEDNLEYKEKVYKDIENKYFVKLGELKYYIFYERLEYKTNNYIENQNKSINTSMGLLKLFLIRIAAIDIVDKQEIKDIIDKIIVEDRYKKIKEHYEELDKLLLQEI